LAQEIGVTRSGASGDVYPAFRWHAVAFFLLLLSTWTDDKPSRSEKKHSGFPTQPLRPTESEREALHDG
jgi:hypothetical protein